MIAMEIMSQSEIAAVVGRAIDRAILESPQASCGQLAIIAAMAVHRETLKRVHILDRMEKTYANV